MKIDASETSIHHFPHAFINKKLEPVLLKTLDPRRYDQLVAMYLAYRPRNSFSGLPPITDEACVRWVRGMVDTGASLIALSFDHGVVGHAALFPMNEETCEMFLVVAHEHQGIGIGTELTRCAVQLADELGFDRIWLSVEAANHIARHVYTKCGFSYLTRSATDEVDMGLDLGSHRDAGGVAVRDIMNRDVIAIRRDESCRAALDLFLTDGVTALPVLGNDGELIGILSETDLLDEANINKKVSDVFTKGVVSVQEACHLSKVIRLFHSRKLRCIPVVDARKQLVGIVGRRDILAHYAADR
jgi:CBS domain-containing protein/RimJ/RimL family protein N-acetyltransferase